MKALARLGGESPSCRKRMSTPKRVALELLGSRDPLKAMPEIERITLLAAMRHLVRDPEVIGRAARNRGTTGGRRHRNSVEADEWLILMMASNSRAARSAAKQSPTAQGEMYAAARSVVGPTP